MVQSNILAWMLTVAVVGLGLYNCQKPRNELRLSQAKGYMSPKTLYAGPRNLLFFFEVQGSLKMLLILIVMLIKNI